MAISIKAQNVPWPFKSRKISSIRTLGSIDKGSKNVRVLLNGDGIGLHKFRFMLWEIKTKEFLMKSIFFILVAVLTISMLTDERCKKCRKPTTAPGMVACLVVGK